MSLQERLHTLLTRLSDTSEILQKWPGGDDASIHIRTTEKLIESIKRIIDGIKSLEEKVNHVSTETSGEQSNESGDEDIANKLRQIAVPLDLLDMMDFAGSLNPDCFARGLIKEALRQMGNLQRRKASMKMLAATIQNGLDARERQLEILKALDEKLAASQGNASENDNNSKDDGVTLEDRKKSESNPDQTTTLETHNKRKRDESEQPSEEEPPFKR
jgi:hypothetical protein